MNTNSEKKAIRIGVIGCGAIANSYHLPALAHVEGIQWGTACDLIQQRAQKAKDEYGFENITTDYKEVLADPTIDAVFIFTKIDSHAEIATASAKAGKQIFMQKAIGYSLQEAQEILDTMQECGVTFTMSFMHRFFDESIKAREIIQSGALGEIQHLRVRNATKNPESTAPSYGGCMMDIGGHGIDLVRFLTGAEVDSVLALHWEGDKGNHGWEANLNGGETFAIQQYTMADGTKVQHEIFWSQAAKTERFDVEIYGRKGVLYLRNPFAEQHLVQSSAPKGVEHGVTWSTPEYPKHFFGQVHHQTFIDDLRFGTNNSQTGEDGFAAIAVIEAARHSMASGGPEKTLTPNATK